MLFDERDLNVFNNSEAKKYFMEIVQSYYCRNYRSSIVMLYSFVIYDLYMKMKVMSNEGDSKATTKLKEIEAIQEGFILDVLQNYTAIDSWYRIMKIIENDPQFDKKRAQKKLRSFVEGNEYTIKRKATMMVEHFHEQVIAKGKIGGQARAMVVTASINFYKR